jgi:hypothetical protein
MILPTTGIRSPVTGLGAPTGVLVAPNGVVIGSPVGTLGLPPAAVQAQQLIGSPPSVDRPTAPPRPGVADR